MHNMGDKKNMVFFARVLIIPDNVIYVKNH